MKKFLLVGALAVLAACGSSGNGVSVSTASPDAGGSTPVATGPGSSSDSTSGSADTISIANVGDMPAECIDLLSTFLKSIEPSVSKIDWKTATLADFESLGTQFQDESDAFDAKSAAAGCNKYNITGSDDDQLKQVVALATAEAPGTVDFLSFLGSLSPSSTTLGTVPADCDGTIAAIESYLGKGTTMRDLTMTEVTQFGNLMRGVTANCTSEVQQAFAARDDVKAFIGS